MNIPDGVYPAKLVHVFRYHNTRGDRIGFEFAIQTPEHLDKRAVLSTSEHLTRCSKLAKSVEQIRGAELSSDELAAGVDLDALVDEICRVLMITRYRNPTTPYSSVERVMQADTW